jgi:hypothetical protein
MSEQHSVTNKQAFAASFIYQLLLIAGILYFVKAHAPEITLDQFKSLFFAWDAHHYLFLAEHGYTTEGDEANFIVFFPFYPILIRLFSFFGYLESALFISTICSIVGHAYFILYLRELGFDRFKIWRVVILLFSSPVAVYFTIAYTESLFLAESALFMYFLQRKQFGLAVLCGFLASMTKMIGILFIVPYVLTCLSIRPFSLDLKNLIKGLGITGGFGVYLAINYSLYKNPFYYLKIQEEHWYKVSVNPFNRYMAEMRGLNDWLTTVWNFFHGTWTGNPSMLLDSPALLFMPFIVMIYLALQFRSPNKMPIAMTVWSFAQVCVFASQSFLMSTARYISMILPVYVMIEEIISGCVVTYVFILGIFLSLAIYVLFLFSQGGWVL